MGINSGFKGLSEAVYCRAVCNEAPSVLYCVFCASTISSLFEIIHAFYALLVDSYIRLPDILRVVETNYLLTPKLDLALDVCRRDVRHLYSRTSQLL